MTFPELNGLCVRLVLLGCACVQQGWPGVLPCFILKAEPSGAQVQAVCTCSTIVPIMKSTPVSGGGFNSVFKHKDKVDLGVYESEGLQGLNQIFDEGRPSCIPALQGLRSHPRRRDFLCGKLSQVYFCYVFVFFFVSSHKRVPCV